MLQGARDLTPSHIRKVVASDFARTLLGSISLVHRLGDAAQRRAPDLGLLVLRARLVPARPDAFGQRAARRDRIDVDAVRAELESELPGKGDDAALRGGVGAARRDAEAAPDDRRQVDDL